MTEGVWLNWPTEYGYWWVKDTPASEHRLVCIHPAKDGNVLALWECPGIGRCYVNGIGTVRYQQVAPPT